MVEPKEPVWNVGNHSVVEPVWVPQVPEIPWVQEMQRFQGNGLHRFHRFHRQVFRIFAAVKCCTRSRPRDWNPTAWLLGTTSKSLKNQALKLKNDAFLGYFMNLWNSKTMRFCLNSELQYVSAIFADTSKALHLPWKTTPMFFFAPRASGLKPGRRSRNKMKKLKINWNCTEAALQGVEKRTTKRPQLETHNRIPPPRFYSECQITKNNNQNNHTTKPKSNADICTFHWTLHEKKQRFPGLIWTRFRNFWIGSANIF